MRDATIQYRKCLGGVVKSQKLVLVVEKGGITGYEVLDITDVCIQRVKTKGASGYSTGRTLYESLLGRGFDSLRLHQKVKTSNPTLKVKT